MLELLDACLFHWSPEKAIRLGAHTLSWDARCAGIHVGVGIGLLYHLLVDRRARQLPPPAILLAAGALFIPLFADVAAVQQGLRAPSNEWRFLTGLAFGQALSVFVYPAFVTLAAVQGAERAVLCGLRRFAGLLAGAGAALLVKGLDNAAAYYVLESLGMLGMCGLFALIVWGGICSFRSFIEKRGRVWGQEQGSAEGRRAFWWRLRRRPLRHS